MGSEHVLGDLEIRDPRGPRPRLVDGLADVRGDPLGREALVAPLGDGRHHLELVEVLDGLTAPLPEPGPAADHHDGGSCLLGLRDPRDRVGEARARGHRGDADLAGGEGPPLGHHHGVLLVSRVDEAEAAHPRALEQRQVVSAGQREQRIHPMPAQHLDQRPATRHPRHPPLLV